MTGPALRCLSSRATKVMHTLLGFAQRAVHLMSDASRGPWGRGENHAPGGLCQCAGRGLFEKAVPAPVRQGSGQSGRKRAPIGARRARMGLNRGATGRKPRYIGWNLGCTGRKPGTIGRKAAAIGLKRAPRQKNPSEPRSAWGCVGASVAAGCSAHSGLAPSSAAAVVTPASTRQPITATVLNDSFIGLSRSFFHDTLPCSSHGTNRGMVSCCVLAARAA